MFQLGDKNHEGLFLTVSLHGSLMHCLIDTGSTMSVLHTKLFDRLPDQVKKKLIPFHSDLQMANGSSVTPLGSISLPLYIENQVIYQNMIEAEIEIPAVLGYDFLSTNRCVIDISNYQIILNSQTFNCLLESQLPSLFRITLGKKITVPPRCEMIVKSNPLNDLPVGSNILIDSTADSLKSKGVLVAKALCTSESDGLPIRVINVSDHPQTISKNTFAATAEPVPGENILNKLPEPSSNEIPQFKEIFDRCRDLVTKDQYQILEDLLNKNKRVFSTSKYDIGLTHVIQHEIETKDARPIKQPPRRLHVPLSQRSEVEAEIQKLLDNNIICPSKSPWSSPFVVVRKADSSLRLCIDFRAVNSKTVVDSYPLPRIDQSLDALKSNCWFSTLDLVSGYYQVAMHPRDAPKTAFATSKGLFEFKRMPFGLCNAGATFERSMEFVLA